ncbi:MAG: chemotaxis protein CheW [Chthoniobacteraceae bacterium]|jgi:purine-binding chemotaxis protein CheW
MKSRCQLVAFYLDDQCYALRLAAVECVFPAAELTMLPDAPSIVEGVINVRGRIIRAVNIRRRFKLAEREMKLSDQMIVATTGKRAVALLVDSVIGVIERWEDEIAPADGILPGLEYIEGVVKFEDGLILIHDLETFLSLEEGETLERAMARMEG